MEKAHARRRPLCRGASMSVQDAAEVLSDLANGRPIEDRSRLIAGALALSAASNYCSDRDLADAAIGLRILATGVTLDLDESGRRRAAFLASTVRRLKLSKAGSIPILNAN